MRKCPSPTGFFKVENLFGELWTEAQRTIARKNLGIDKLPTDSNIWVNDNPPNDLDQLWLEPSQEEYINEEGNLTTLRQSIRVLQQQMEQVIRLVNYGIIGGNASSGGRTQMIQDTIIDPITGESALVEPSKLTGTVPNISIKCDTKDNFQTNKNNLIDGELIWIVDMNSLYIYLNNKFTAITTTTSGGGLTVDDIEKLYFTSIGLQDNKGNQYRLQVNSDGTILVYNNTENVWKDSPNTSDKGSYISGLLKINQVFIGKPQLDSFSACSHNFVELANASENDINLYGLCLLYKSPNKTTWDRLDLKGTIKSGSTFLIRGQRCSYKSNITIDIHDYDMQWFVNNKLIEFDQDGGTFYLAQTRNGKLHNGTVWQDILEIANPWSEVGVVQGYIDSVGIKGTAEINIPAEGGKPISIKEGEHIHECVFVRAFPLDPCSQAQKDHNKKASSTLWTYFNMNKQSSTGFPYYTESQKLKFVPEASKYNKNIFGVRTVFSNDIPNMVNVTFGIQATDEGSGATRCFNWVSCGYYDEFVQYKLKGQNTWNEKPSISKDNLAYADDVNVQTFISIYDRIKWLSTNKTPVTTHKAIIRNLQQGTYEYRVGREGHWSDIMEFTVKANVQSFNFVHTSDQQSFNYYEYQAWTKSAWVISQKETPDFIINTGDITQNGNRENEWLDYYEGRKYLRNVEEMYTIGNNDLCGIIPYELGNGDASTFKINHKNIQYYYTFELDINNPQIFKYVNPDLNYEKCKNEVLEKGEDYFTYYMPSLYSFNYGNYHFVCINSEFADNTSKVYYDGEVPNMKEHAYYNMYKWLQKDLQNNSLKNTICFAHEIPFCIVKAMDNQTYAGARTSTNGSKLNMDFSAGVQYSDQVDTNNYQGGCCFSELFQIHKVSLVLGGHKHTYSLSYPTKENIIINNNSRTVDYAHPVVDTINNSVESGPVYAMIQATGYKLVSNKDLPGDLSTNNTNWLRKQFAINTPGVADTNQYNPMYSVCSIKNNSINFQSYYIDNIYDGKTAFDINKQLINFTTTNRTAIDNTNIIINGNI